MKRPYSTADFVEKHTKTPNISFETGSNLFEDFWCNVVSSATVSISLLIFFQLFTESKVDKLAMARAVNHDIFRFQISVQDPQCVKLLQATDNFSDIKLVVVLKCLGLHLAKITSADQVHFDGQLSVSLVSAQQLREPNLCLVEHEHDFLLPDDLVSLSCILNFAFAYNFYGELVFIFVLSHKNGAEFTLTYFLKYFVISFIVQGRELRNAYLGLKLAL